MESGTEAVHARVSAVCPSCGTVELSGAELTLVRCRAGGPSWYVFDCLGCVRQVRKPAGAAVTAALLRGGITVCELPAEVLEQRTAERRPMTGDELLDVLLELRTTDDVSALR